MPFMMETQMQITDMHFLRMQNLIDNAKMFVLPLLVDISSINVKISPNLKL